MGHPAKFYSHIVLDYVPPPTPLPPIDYTQYFLPFFSFRQITFAGSNPPHKAVYLLNDLQNASSRMDICVEGIGEEMRLFIHDNEERTAFFDLEMAPITMETEIQIQ